MYWILLAFLATIISSIGVLLMKIVGNSRYDNNIFLAISYIIVGILGLIYYIYKKNRNKNLKIDKGLLLYSLGFAIFIFICNIIIQEAFSKSPNISYTHIIINLNIIITLIFSNILFKEEINRFCFIGILIALIGIIIIVFNYKA
tara:strand:- start:485 stop:919 length:435 start_codon:yes stop_codon:yes gene_type:complete